jgi:hypothetical protein
MVKGNSLATLIIERDAVIRARTEALRRMAAAEGRNKERIHSEFFKPLNERLLALNKELGV